MSGLLRNCIKFDVQNGSPITGAPAAGDVGKTWHEGGRIHTILDVGAGPVEHELACLVDIPVIPALPEIQCGSFPINLANFPVPPVDDLGNPGIRCATITFTTAFSVAPCVNLQLCTEKGCAVNLNIVEGTITATDFEVDLGTSQLPASGEIHWFASVPA